MNCDTTKRSRKSRSRKHGKRSRDSSSVSRSGNASCNNDSDSSPPRKVKKKLKKMKKKKSKKSKKKKNYRSDSSSTSKEDSDNDCCQVGPAVPEEIVARSKMMAPMSKEEWERRQSNIKRVYDEESGRYRLVRGDGEIIEECVSRDRHRQINKQATAADGLYFQAQLKKK